MNHIHKPKALRIKIPAKQKRSFLDVKKTWKKKQLSKKFHKVSINNIDQIESQPEATHSDECDLCWKCHKLLGTYEEHVCFECKMKNCDKSNCGDDSDDSENSDKMIEDIHITKTKCKKKKISKYMPLSINDIRDENNIEMALPSHCYGEDIDVVCEECDNSLGLGEDTICFECEMKMSDQIYNNDNDEDDDL